MSRKSNSLVILVAMVAGLGYASSRSSETPRHLEVARKLVEDLRGSSLNTYGGGKREIEWQLHPVQARTVCSSFTTLLLQHAYGWNNDFFSKWLSHTNPEAEIYHDAVESKNGFLRIEHVGAIKPGDFIAIKYTDHHVSKNGVEDTGHVMLVDSIETGTKAKEPTIPGTHQVFVRVIDSSASGHGTSDTRHIGPNKFTGGIGSGIFRIYADSDDHVAGYAWSDSKNSEVFKSPERDLVIGRLDEKRLPRD